MRDNILNDRIVGIWGDLESPSEESDPDVEEYRDDQERHELFNEYRLAVVRDMKDSVKVWIEDLESIKKTGSNYLSCLEDYLPLFADFCNKLVNTFDNYINTMTHLF